MKIETTIKLLNNIKKPYWTNCKLNVNSYNNGFNEGIERAIRLLHIAEDDTNS